MTARTGGPWWRANGAWTAMVVLLLLFALSTVVRPPGAGWDIALNIVLYNAVQATGTVVALQAARRVPAERTAWLAVAAWGLLSIAANLTYSTMAMVLAEVPIPSVCDALYLACLPRALRRVVRAHPRPRRSLPPEHVARRADRGAGGDRGGRGRPAGPGPAGDRGTVDRRPGQPRLPGGRRGAARPADRGGRGARGAPRRHPRRGRRRPRAQPRRRRRLPQPGQRGQLPRGWLAGPDLVARRPAARPGRPPQPGSGTHRARRRPDPGRLAGHGRAPGLQHGVAGGPGHGLGRQLPGGGRVVRRRQRAGRVGADDGDLPRGAQLPGGPPTGRHRRAHRAGQPPRLPGRCRRGGRPGLGHAPGEPAAPGPRRLQGGQRRAGSLGR